MNSDTDVHRGDEPPPQPPSRPSSNRTRLIVLVVAATAFVTLLVVFRGELLLGGLAKRESQFRQFRTDHPVLIYGVAFGVYVTITGLQLPMAGGLSLLYGWLFGLWRGVILVSFASTSGATLAFLLSRYLLRDFVQHRFGDRLEGFNRALEREGAFYLFTLRLIVGVPFFVINAVMGLTPIRVWTFWWVSQIGMLPATCVFLFAGSSVPSLEQIVDRSEPILTPELIVAFALLGVFFLLLKKIMGAIRPAAAVDDA